jgi:serine/threonine-protein kinase
MTSAGEVRRRDAIAALRDVPVLRRLGDEGTRRLIEQSDSRRFSGGTAIMPHGASPAVVVLLEGTCAIERSDSRTPATPELVAVESIAAVVGVPGIGTVRAVDDVRALLVDRASFVDGVRNAAAAGQELTELVASRLCTPGAPHLADRFVIDGVVGEGGSGRVLRARHAMLGIPLALKMLSHALALSPEGRRSFIREAAVLVHLDHPGIVRIVDVFDAHDTFFMVMPWIAGHTLRDHIDAGEPRTPERVFEIAEEALDALVALHAAGLVHRDVKPSNILIKPSGRLVLIDFGIACQRNQQAARRELVGSPSYCSPEQILGRPLDGRSDVYSLACTLHEVVFGRPPFEADDIDGVIDGHLHGALSLDREARVPMGEPFLRWLRACLSRTRASRPDAVAARGTLRYLAPEPGADRSVPRARVTVPVPMFLVSGEPDDAV